MRKPVGMPNFQASLLDVNSKLSVTISSDSLTATIEDTSNYIASTEDGNEAADFADYRKIYVTDPNNVEYLFSSVTGGDETILPGDSGSNSFDYDILAGDGVYTFRLVTVPTYDAAVAYSIAQYVYSAGKIYKSLQSTNTGHTPASSAAWWSENTDDTMISAKYNTYGKLGLVSSITDCWLEAIHDASCETAHCTDLCTDADFKKAMKLDLLLTDIANQAEGNKWDNVAWLITQAKTICTC